MTNAPTLLHIEASPRKTRSHSSAVGRAFVDAYRDLHGPSAVATLDLWAGALPPLDEALIDARFAVLKGAGFTQAQHAAWMRALEFGEAFKRAERLLFTVPMWNRGIPYVLKHYIDLITQPGVLFERTAAGYRPLGPDRPAVVIYASGSDFSAGSALEPFDYQKPYFNNWLKFVGVSRIEQIVLAPTVGDDHLVHQSRAAALRRAVELARSP
jgi:FMN-dependent NADH-azoreductase